MNQTQSPAILDRLVGVPRRLFRTRSLTHQTTKTKSASDPTQVMFVHQPRLSVEPIDKSPAPQPRPRALTHGTLALKRPWPKAAPENLFRDDFDI
ncbi:MAG: hypothetical protein AAFW64_04410 [Pseudomonadota bacterium]